MEADVKIVTMRVKGLKLFSSDWTSIDLYATGRVSSKDTGTRRFSGAGTSVSSQTVVAFAGLNATGKSTTLRLLSLASQIVIGTALNDGTCVAVAKLLEESGLDLQIVLEHAGEWYLLESHVDSTGNLWREPTSADNQSPFRFGSETLWQHRGRRISKKELADVDTFRSHCEIMRTREGLSKELAVALGRNRSIVTLLRDGGARGLGMGYYDSSLNIPMPVSPIPTQVVRFFDNTVEHLELDGENVFHVKFAGEERSYDVSPLDLPLLLSSGTMRGSQIMQMVISVLMHGDMLLVDELENSLNKRLIQTIFDLFTSQVTNPHGACLIFTTHYPELLDYLDRTDCIYFMRRMKNGKVDASKLSDLEPRYDIKRSEMFLSNQFGATAPKAAEIMMLRDYITHRLSEDSEQR